MPSPGRSELLTSGILSQGDSVVFCGHGFGLQWFLGVVLPLVFQCEQRVPALQVSHVVSRSAPSMAIPDGLGVIQTEELNLLSWFEIVFFLLHFFSLGKLKLLNPMT